MSTPYEIEKKHTSAKARNVTTNYKAAFRELAALFKTQSEDTRRLDFVENTVIYNSRGVSFDHIPACDGDAIGFRFMRRFHIGEPAKTLRQAIDNEMPKETKTS